MSRITYVTGDATDPIGEGPKVIAHVCNDVGKWGAGFTGAISKRWAEPERRFREFDARMLGTCETVEVGPGLYVENMYAQHGVRRPGSRAQAPIRYNALAKCLRECAVDAEIYGTLSAYVIASVHMPRIGCGLAGGEWSKVEALIKETLCFRGLSVFVYDLPVSA